MEVESRMLCMHCAWILVCLASVGTISRTKQWRLQRKRRMETAAAAGLDHLPPPKRKHKQHKKHECRQCHQSLNCKCYMDMLILLFIEYTLADTGHTNYYGTWHCPNVPNAVPVEEWKVEQKARLSNKRAAHQQQ